MTVTEETPVQTDEAADVAVAAAFEQASEKNRAEAIALFAIAFAAISVLTAVFAVGIAIRAVDRAENAAPAGGGGGAAVATVTMTDFAFTPDAITVAAGGSIEFVNDANQPHDFHVEDLSTPHVDGGDSYVLDVSSLAPGTYDVWCEIPGHKDSGMTGTLTIT